MKKEKNLIRVMRGRKDKESEKKQGRRENGEVRTWLIYNGERSDVLQLLPCAFNKCKEFVVGTDIFKL